MEFLVLLMVILQIVYFLVSIRRVIKLNKGDKE